ncbi:MAG: 16S rRNA (uracil(1498)-N(3))-methyltransferase [Bacteriovoracaceae bacterium]
MRASFTPDLQIENEYLITGDRLHHLVKVIRIEEGDELLLINGQGLQVKTKVLVATKRELRLGFLESHKAPRKYLMDLALGMPKREALELCLKEATELGFRRIFLIRSEFSQMKYPDDDRVENLIVSAMEQSNAPFLPIVTQTEWEKLPWNEFDQSVLMDSQTQDKVWKSSEFKNELPNLLIVGPEGGFSPVELGYLHQQANLKVLNLPTPILRSPTALATGAGFLLQSLLNR